LIQRADLVFVLSRKLLEENQRYNPHTVLLPNAVDFEHFSRARDARTQLPDDLSAIPTPRIGYVGSINEKVDLALLEKMAATRQDWSIVLIGRQNFSAEESKRQFDRLLAKPNIYWIPYRQPDQLPAYLKGLDVCLMCYVINGWTYYGDPSKMHEYLAAGKPTVGTALPSILEYRHVVEVPTSHDQWITAVTRCLADNGEGATMQRVEIARLNSYAERVRTAVGVIKERFGARLTD
jgi:glycosyltransferase involved in cell wall biosynthesis